MDGCDSWTHEYRSRQEWNMIHMMKQPVEDLCLVLDYPHPTLKERTSDVDKHASSHGMLGGQACVDMHGVMRQR